MEEARAGENVGVLLRGIEKDDIERGMVLSHQIQSLLTKNSRSVYILKKEEGGRHKPFFSGYRPHSTYVQLTLLYSHSSSGTEMVMPVITSRLQPNC